MHIPAAAIAATAASVLCNAAHAAMQNLWIDYALFDGLYATVDGVHSPNEYSNSGNFPSIATGGGGVLGPNSELLINANGSITFGFRPGAPLAETVIILLDTRPGGRIRGSGPGITPFGDTTDAARRALSSLQGRLPFIQTPGDVGYDVAITINSDGFGLFQLPDDQHASFTQLGGYTGVVGPGGFREAAYARAQLGTTFNNPSIVYAGDNFLYNESMPDQQYYSGPNPGPQIGVANPTNIDDLRGFGMFIPTPGATGAAALAAVILSRRPKRAEKHLF